ncbi:MAG: hypothetical protein R3E89_19310 [Thiolinea sp.]
MNIRETLDTRITAALPLRCSCYHHRHRQALGPPEFGDYQANGIMAAAKQLKV